MDKKPVRSWTEFSLPLRERIMEIHLFLQTQFFQGRVVALWIRGSQVKRWSFSKSPDIDFIVFHPDLVRLNFVCPERWRTMTQSIQKKCPYKMDIFLLQELMPETKMRMHFGPCIRVPLPAAAMYKYVPLCYIKHHYHKIPTPLDSHVSYPIHTFDQAGTLLVQRARQIQSDLIEYLGLEPTVRMWIRGSQQHGHSRSQSPDIDFVFASAELEEREPRGWVMWQLQHLLVDVWYFKVDLTWINREQYVPQSALWVPPPLTQ